MFRRLSFVLLSIVLSVLRNTASDHPFGILKAEFEDTKGVIKIRILKKNRQHNGQKKKDKRTNNDLQNIHIKLQIE